MGVQGGGDTERSVPRGQEECCFLRVAARLACGAGRSASLLQFSPPTSPLRVLMVLQVPRVWLDRGASLVFLGSVVREDSPACLAPR